MGTQLHRDGLTQDRAIRVFISSTFRDMQEERDLLVKRVFPKLRKLCTERGVAWTEVDLRWGITDEEKAEGKVLPLCLGEIERCRPYFIGLLGERYGWVPSPEDIPQDLLAEQDWLKEHLDKSVTELEILHGVLRNPEMAGNAFFYFRDASYIDSIEENLRSDFVAHTSEETQKLNRLKNEIRDAAQSGFCSLYESYSTPDNLADRLDQDFTHLINDLFPLDSAPPPDEIERNEHAAFARDRCDVYIGRHEYFAALDHHMAQAPGQPLAVLGESGSGKSALLANWANRLRVRENDTTSVWVLEHYIGSTATSADWCSLVKRLMSKVATSMDLDVNIPTDPEELTAAFTDLLAETSLLENAPHIVLILDGLDQLEDKGTALTLTWLPHSYPKNVTLIVSTLPGRTRDAIEERGWPTLTVEPLEPDERRSLVEDYLRTRYAKKLSDDLISLIAKAPQAGNPLYLRAVLEELRLFGRHEQLKGCLEHYLAASDLAGLYARILERWENDYDRDRPGLVSHTMKLLWASRCGLTEAELLEMLRQDTPSLRQATWSVLCLAIHNSLSIRNGKLTFFHNYLRQAVETRYIDETTATAIHSRLADYFSNDDPSTRQLAEWPWQLMKAGRTEDLAACLTDLAIFPGLYDSELDMLPEYWRSLGDDYVMLDCYIDALQDQPATESTASVYLDVLAFLFQSGVRRGLSYLFKKARALFAKLKIGEFERDDLLSMYLYYLKDVQAYTQAETLLRDRLREIEESHGPRSEEALPLLMDLASVLDWDTCANEIHEIHRLALSIAREIHGARSPEAAEALHCLALDAEENHETAEAERCLKEAISIGEECLGPTDPDIASDLLCLARVLAHRDKTEAREHGQRALDICTSYYGARSPRTIRARMAFALVLRTLGETDTGETLLRDALSIAEDTIGSKHPAVCDILMDLALFLEDRKAFSEAEDLLMRAQEVSREAYGRNHEVHLKIFGRLGDLMRKVDRPEDAEAWDAAWLGVRWSKRKSNTDTGSSADEYDEGEPSLHIFKHQLADIIEEKGADSPEALEHLMELASRLTDEGRREEARTHYEMALDICKNRGEGDGPDAYDILDSLSHICENLGDIPQAIEYLMRTIKIEEDAECGGILHDMNRQQLADLLIFEKRFAEAEPILRDYAIEELAAKQDDTPESRAEFVEKYQDVLAGQGMSPDQIRDELESTPSSTEFIDKYQHALAELGLTPDEIQVRIEQCRKEARSC